ncbi:MAG: MerR family transcriptional regulator, partial [Acidimicrobiales bacterium]
RYSEVHLTRLRLIGQLLERGYTLANIRELLDAWESGQNVGELFGLEEALSAPWSDETPVVLRAEELAAMFGRQLDATAALAAAQGAVAAGILEPVDDGFLVKSPRLLHIANELVSAGIPAEVMLDLGVRLSRAVDDVARMFVDLVTEHVVDPVGEPIPPSEVPRLTEVIRRLRPLATQSVDTLLADAMERLIAEELGARMSRLQRKSDQSEAS